MKDKPADIPYCGVREDVIKGAMPTLNEYSIELLRSWITERYSIRVKKDVLKKEAPWTNDQILRTVKFTNVFREDDRTTKWLIDNVINTDISYENKILNCIMFRTFNKLETCELVGMPIDFTHHLDGDEDGIKKIHDEMRATLTKYQEENPDYVFYTPAFNTGGFKFGSVRLTGEEYIPMRPIAFMDYIIKDDILNKVLTSESPVDVIDHLKNYTGIGPFLSYQIFVDFTYIEQYPFSENHFTVSGPGCSLGLSYLFEDKDGMTDEECLFWLRDNDHILGINWKVMLQDRPEYDRKTNIMSLENCMCEYSKYYRCTDQLKEGKKPRARVKYDGEGAGSATLTGFLE